MKGDICYFWFFANWLNSKNLQRQSRSPLVKPRNSLPSRTNVCFGGSGSLA